LRFFNSGAFQQKPHFCAMKYWILLLAVGIVQLSCQNGDGRGQQKEQHLANESSDTLSRVNELTLAIRENPKDPELYFQRANAHIQDKMLLLALDDAERAISADSLNSAYHALKGEIQYLNKKPAKAVESYEKALELNPDNTDALLKMAEIKLLLRQYQDCFDLANKALRVNEQLYMAYFIKGYAHYELGDSNLFVSSVQTALELNPNFYDGYVMLGSFYASLDSELALDYYNSALEVRPDDGEALYGKAIFLQNQGRIDEALELYQYMIDLDEKNTLAWYNRGYIWLELREDPDKAIPLFEKAIELHPEYTEAIYNLGLCYERKGLLLKAQDYYRQALEIDPQYDLAALGLERLAS